MQIKKNFNLNNDLKYILSNTDSLWENIRDKNIFLTGGTGFFGKWILESFIYANEQKKLNASITVLSRNPAKFAKDFAHLANGLGVNLLEGDIVDFEFPKVKFEYVIHAATEASAQLNEENPLKMFDTIVCGTRRVLDFAVECGARKFLLTSSGAVYGKQPAELANITEDYNGAPDTLNSLSTYGEAKRASELLCSIYKKQYNLSFSIARCFAFVGPYLNLDIHFAIGNFIRNILSEEEINIKGDGTPYRSYMYAADLAISLWTILINGEETAYNVGSDKPVSIAELAEIVASFDDKNQTKINIAERIKKDNLATRYVPSIDKLQKELKITNTISLEEGIEKTINWNKILDLKMCKEKENIK